MLLLLFRGNKSELGWEQIPNRMWSVLLGSWTARTGIFSWDICLAVWVAPTSSSSFPKFPPESCRRSREAQKNLGWKDLKNSSGSTTCSGQGQLLPEMRVSPRNFVPEALEGPLGSFQSVGGTHRQNKPQCVPFPCTILKPCSASSTLWAGEEEKQEELQQEFGVRIFLIEILSLCHSPILLSAKLFCGNSEENPSFLRVHSGCC